MAHIFKMEEWQDNDKWVCGDVSALAAGSNTWWYVPALLNLTPVEYFYFLKDKFHASHFHYTTKHDVFLFSKGKYRLFEIQKNVLRLSLLRMVFDIFRNHLFRTLHPFLTKIMAHEM